VLSPPATLTNHVRREEWQPAEQERARDKTECFGDALMCAQHAALLLDHTFGLLSTCAQLHVQTVTLHEFRNYTPPQCTRNGSD
jgi:hypothetical protein